MQTTYLKCLDSIRPVCLPGIDEEHDHTGDVAIATGWGDTRDFDPKLSPVLQKVNLTVVGISDCIPVYDSLTLNGTTQICVSGNNGKSTCSVSIISIHSICKYHIFLKFY